MQIRNVRGATLEIAATRDYVEPDDVIDLPDDLATSLLEQPANWAPVEKPTTRSKPTKENDR